jgi:hypothetical protein
MIEAMFRDVFWKKGREILPPIPSWVAPPGSKGVVAIPAAFHFPPTLCFSP